MTIRFYPDAFRLAMQASADPIGSVWPLVSERDLDEVRSILLAAVCWGTSQHHLVGRASDGVSVSGDVLLAEIVNACSRPEPWSLEDVRILLELMAEPRRWTHPSRIGLVFNTLDGLSDAELAAVEQHLLLVAQGMNGVAEEHRERFASYVPNPMPIDEALASIQPIGIWGRRVRTELRAVEIDPATLEAIVRIATDAATDQKRRRWFTEFDLLSQRRGVGEAFEVMVRCCIREVEFQDSLLGFRSEPIVCGAALLLGVHTNLCAPSRMAGKMIQLLERVAFLGAQWNFNRPNSGPVARSAVAGIREIGGDLAVVSLHRLQERYPDRRGLSKHVNEAISALLGEERTLAEILAASGPTFGLNGEGVRSWDTDSNPIEVRLIDGRAVVGPTEDEAASGSQISARAQAKETAAGINKELGLLRRRFERYVRNVASFTPQEFDALTNANPLIASVAETLIWRFRTEHGWTVGSLNEERTPAQLAGAPRIESWTEASLWHPKLATDQEVTSVRDHVSGCQLSQAVPQAFRETYEDGDVVLGPIPLKSAKTEALMRARGWKFTSLGGWDGGDEGSAIWRHPTSGFTAEVLVRMPQVDSDGPRAAGSWCVLSGLQIDSGTLAATDETVAVLTSEVMRDLELVAVVAAPTGKAITDPDSPFHGLLLAQFDEPLRGSGRVRHQALQYLLDGPLGDQPFELTETELHVHKREQTYRIHLNRGLIRGPDGQLLSKRGSNKVDLPWLPVEPNGTLGKIVRIALSLVR